MLRGIKLHFIKMSTTIFYFTGTGNCLYVARNLANELGDARLVNIASVIDKNIDLSGQRIGLVYPVYMFGMPLIVSKFIKKLKAGKDKYFFAVATYGGKACNTLKQNAREFAAFGLKLSAGFLIKMPGNYTPLYGAINEKSQNRLFEESHDKIKNIARIVSSEQTARIETDSFLVAGLFSLIYKLGSGKIPAMDKGFWPDEKCNSCGICVKVCPVNNVELASGKPKWLGRCQQCMACLQWCPQEAIQYGKNTAYRKRYHHPEIKLEDLMHNNI
ncbi:MAG: 4Fe-4S ferredoxin [Candidatus Omnitrophota bacterium]|jgi:ferredoxin|nr:MAG: 4Fe-4S ferredoxin [Candidatus Omnitrophota bacterium]